MDNYHVFIQHKFQRPVNCKACAKPIWGYTASKKQGFTCKLCMLPVHKKCAPSAHKRICQEAALADNYIQFKNVIKDNTLKHMQKLLWQIGEDPNLEAPKKLQESTTRIMAATVETFNPQLGEDIEKVWSDKFIQKTFEQKMGEWQIPPSADFFFENATRLGDPDYKPNSQDVMRARPQEQAKSYKDQTKKINNINEDAEYNTYLHGTGEQVENVNVTLSSLNILEIYYYPVGRSPPTRASGEVPRRSLMATKDRRIGGSNQKRPASASPTVKATKKKDADFEERNGTFTLTIGAMQDLANFTEAYDSLYFILTNDVSEKQCRSKLVPNSDMPEWKEVFKFPVNCDTIEFKLVLWATTKTSQTVDIMMGEATATFSKFSDGDARFGIWRLKKEPKKFKRDKERNGEIQVNWKYGDKKRKAPQECGPPKGPTRQKSRFIPTAILISATDGEISTGATTERSGRDDERSRESSPRRRDEKDKKRGHRTGKKGEKEDKSDSVKKTSSPSSQAPAVPEEDEGGATLEEVYEVGEELGSGAFSVVKAGVHKKTGALVAVKILDNYGNLEDADEEMESFQRETSIMQMLKHKNVVQLMDVFEDEEHYYVVMEQVGGGELFDQIIDKGCYPEEEAVVLIHQVFSALKYMHGKGIAHRDIKPENLLFSNDKHDTLKIVDFGEAKFVGDGLFDYVGTPDYMAPEILKGQKYGTLVDTWAMGVVIYIMLCGFPPFDGETDTDVLCNIMNIAYDFPSPEWDDVSELAKDFVRRLMTDADKRMSSKETLEHPWMLEHIKKK